MFNAYLLLIKKLVIIDYFQISFKIITILSTLYITVKSYFSFLTFCTKSFFIHDLDINNHPTIISAKQFEQVIQEIKRRSNVLYDEYGKAHKKDSKHSSKVKDH